MPLYRMRMLYSAKRNLRDESLAFLDVLLQLRQASLKEFLLLSREFTNGVNLLNTVRLESDVRKGCRV